MSVVRADLMRAARMKSISAGVRICLTLSRVRIFQRSASFLSRAVRLSKSWLIKGVGLLQLLAFRMGGNLSVMFPFLVLLKHEPMMVNGTNGPERLLQSVSSTYALKKRVNKHGG